MTIILFLVDTSSSMCQKAFVDGVQQTYLDIAKGAVETFFKYRQRTMDCCVDRYMLLTFEEPPFNVKAGWKENHAIFMNELKNLQSHGLTVMGSSLRNAFDLLNLNRMQSGIDTFGQGRCPFYLEPSVIIVITDGGKYSYSSGVYQDIVVPAIHPIPGTKLAKESFRWDQRIFAFVLRMPGHKIEERLESTIPRDESPIERMCEVTGGRSYRIRSHYVLIQSIENLLQKIKSGVVLQFEPRVMRRSSTSGAALIHPPPDIIFKPVKKMIYVQKHLFQRAFPAGNWPLPEPFWPDSNTSSLPPREAHPKLKVLIPGVDCPLVVEGFPVDKYEVESGQLTKQILNRRETNKCWPVVITNDMEVEDLPFGYLKAGPNFNRVYLHVLAYNYPALLPALHDLIQRYNMSPPADLLYKLNAYARSIPQYYLSMLHKALVKINVPHELMQFLIPDTMENGLSPTVANQLKVIKNTAKHDQENLCRKVYKQLRKPKPPYRQIETAKLAPEMFLKRDLVRHPLMRDTFANLHAEIEPVDSHTIVVPQLTPQRSAKSYRNPFDIPRRDLLEEIARMRELLLRPNALVSKDSGCSLPIAMMGNYQENLGNNHMPLREIEPKSVRQHMFGNPFRKNKHMVMVDEADLNDVVSGSSTSSSSILAASSSLGPVRDRKRKAGPLPLEFEFHRQSRSSSPASSVESSDDSYSSDLPSSTSILTTKHSEQSTQSDASEPVTVRESCVFAEDHLVVIDLTNEETDDQWNLKVVEFGATARVTSHGSSSSSPILDMSRSGSLNFGNGVSYLPISGPRPRAAYSTNLCGEAASLYNPLQGPGTSKLKSFSLDNAMGMPGKTEETSRLFPSSDACSMSGTDTSKISYSGTSSDGPELTHSQLLAARNYNSDLRLQIFRDIRRPGRDYSKLLEHLNLVKGDHKMKSDFIKKCILESRRFRRHHMVSIIQRWWHMKQRQEKQQ